MSKYLSNAENTVVQAYTGHQGKKWMIFHIEGLKKISFSVVNVDTLESIRRINHLI